MKLSEMKYTLYDLLYAKGASEPLRAAVQAQMAKLEATVETQNRLLDAKQKDHEIIQEKNNALRARLKAVESELQSWKDVAKRFSNEADALRTHLSFAKDELNQLRADIEIMKQQSNLSIPDPMGIFTDQDLLKVAEAWREFDAPSGADEFGRRIYGSIRSALNAYRDRLITLRRMEIIPTDSS